MTVDARGGGEDVMVTPMALFETKPESLPLLKRENAQLRRAVEELAVLNDLAVEIASTHSLDVIMRRIVKRALSVSGADQGVITIVNEDEPDSTARTLVRTRAPSSHANPMHPPEAALGWLQLNRHVLSLDLRQPDERFRSMPWPDGAHTVLLVPLLVRGRLTGMLTLYNKENGATFSSEDRRLLSIIAAQSAQVIENARLLEEEKEHLRMQEEIRLARRMQISLLPEAPPSIPGFDVSGISVPARTVGGDYFDYVPINDGHWALAVGDVVGKGFPAALLMANLQATLRAHLGSDVPDVAQTLARVNDQLQRSLRPGTFASLVLAILDPASGDVSYANAGHNRPFVIRKDGAVECLSQGGLVLGVRSGIRYEAADARLAPGDVLVLFSDGVTEAMNAAREEFGETRFIQLLTRCRSRPAAAILRAVIEAIEHHADGLDPNDDITLIVAKRAEMQLSD